MTVAKRHIYVRRDLYLLERLNQSKSSLSTSKKSEQAHGRWRNMIRNKDYEVSEVVLDIRHTKPTSCSHRLFRNQPSPSSICRILGKWQGLDIEKWVWVSIEWLNEDMPSKINDYLIHISETGNRRQKKVASIINHSPVPSIAVCMGRFR